MAKRLTKPPPSDLKPGDLKPLVLRKKQVLALVGLSASTVRSMQLEGRFPEPIKLSVRATGWLSREIEAWLAAKAAERAA